MTARAVKGVVQLETGGRKQLFYLVEWEDTDRIEKISASIVRKKIPDEVIKFLSSKIKWTTRKTHADLRAKSTSKDFDESSAKDSKDKNSHKADEDMDDVASSHSSKKEASVSDDD